MKYTLEIIIIGCAILIVSVIIYKNSNNYQEIYMDVIEPSNAKMVFSPIMGDTIELKFGDFITIEIISDIENYEIIDTNNILEIKNDKIIAKNTGKTKIYAVNKEKNLKSNFYTINVIK